MFGLFKSKKQKAQEMMGDISRGMIKDALEERGEHVNDYKDTDEFCRLASVAFGRIMIKELEKANGSVDDDDKFTVGVFVMGATNYTTAVMSGRFEETCTLALLDYYRGCNAEDAGELSGETINTYNGLMGSGNAGKALMTQIANFFEHSGDEYLEKVMKLYGVLRSNLK